LPDSDPIVCLVTAPRADADSIASTIVDKRLGACVNVVALVRSFYRWEGRTQQDEEALLVVKTTRAAIPQLDELLEAIHPYDTFELVALDVLDLQVGRSWALSALLYWLSASDHRR
jgi:periplasmic divalent cation tolerance protein